MSVKHKRVVLGDIANISSGGTPSRSNPAYWNGNIPWVKTTQIQNCIINRTDVDEWITDEGLKKLSAKMISAGTILMAMYGQGKTRGQVSILNFDASINQACAAIDLKNGICRDFVYQSLLASYTRIRNMSNTGGQENLSAGLIKEIPLTLPPLPEQKAIADLLSTWDEAIEKTERLIQAKEANLKGQIQRIMGKEAIDANDWSMVHLGELFSEVTRKVGEKWGKDISGSQHKNYTHLKAGEFSYNKGNSKRYQQGCVYLLKDGEICVPNVFISFKPKAKNVVPEFFEHYFIADYHARELKRYITSGARSDGLLNLNKKDFFKIVVPCPSPDEQKAIAEALTASQHEIDLLKQLADKYKTQKRGLMQKMLTGEWRVKPEIVNQYVEA
ncbi:MAG: restriction endonuclease subunit S [Spartobacteria bacterium]|nr:restriction endonuclease subunit S [Spartobacteria bacterium]